MSIRLNLILLASVSSLLLLFGGVARGIRSLGKGTAGSSLWAFSSSPTNTLTTLRESTYECA